MKIKKRLLFAFILTGLIIFISCSSNNNPTTPNNNNKVNFSSLAYLNYWINNNYNISNNVINRTEKFIVYPNLIIHCKKCFVYLILINKI